MVYACLYVWVTLRTCSSHDADPQSADYSRLQNSARRRSTINALSYFLLSISSACHLAISNSTTCCLLLPLLLDLNALGALFSSTSRPTAARLLPLGGPLDGGVLVLLLLVVLNTLVVANTS